MGEERGQGNKNGEGKNYETELGINVYFLSLRGYGRIWDKVFKRATSAGLA